MAAHSAGDTIYLPENLEKAHGVTHVANWTTVAGFSNSTAAQLEVRLLLSLIGQTKAKSVVAEAKGSLSKDLKKSVMN